MVNPCSNATLFWQVRERDESVLRDMTVGSISTKHRFFELEFSPPLIVQTQELLDEKHITAELFKASSAITTLLQRPNFIPTKVDHNATIGEAIGILTEQRLGMLVAVEVKQSNMAPFRSECDI